MLTKIQLLQNYENMVRMQYCHFFQEKNWGRSEKMDKNKCPIFLSDPNSFPGKNDNIGLLP